MNKSSDQRAFTKRKDIKGVICILHLQPIVLSYIDHEYTGILDAIHKSYN